jgi:hypothetical protein
MVVVALGRAQNTGDLHLGIARCPCRNGQLLADLDFGRTQLTRLRQLLQCHTEAPGDGVEVVSLDHHVGGGGGVILTLRVMAWSLGQPHGRAACGKTNDDHEGQRKYFHTNILQNDDQTDCSTIPDEQKRRAG